MNTRNKAMTNKTANHPSYKLLPNILSHAPVQVRKQSPRAGLGISKGWIDSQWPPTLGTKLRKDKNLPLAKITRRKGQSLSLLPAAIPDCIFWHISQRGKVQTWQWGKNQSSLIVFTWCWERPPVTTA